MEKINVEALSARPRNDLLHELEKKITENGGWVMDHQMFSNTSISLWVVIENVKLEKIFTDLQLIGLDLNSRRIESIMLDKVENHALENIILSLTISFINSLSTKSLRISV
jgi:hypothetical protein